MELITLADAREMLWEYAPAGPDGLKVLLSSATTDEKAYWRGKLNQVIERLLLMTKPRGSWVKVPSIPIYDGLLTLPRMFNSCSGVNVSCGPRPIYSRFWEFTAAGPAFCCSNAVIPVNDSAQTFIIPTGTYQLRARTTTTADQGKAITFFGGLDESGDEIFTSTILTLSNDLGGGVYSGSENVYAGSILIFAGMESSVPTTSEHYTSLPRISKVVTEGPVFLYSVVNVDTVISGEILAGNELILGGDETLLAGAESGAFTQTTEVETLIAIYAPGEKTPAYKQYRIANLGTEETSAECLCKLGYVAAVADTDLIIPGVYGALKHGLKALTYEDTSDDRQDAEWQRALNILNDDRHELDGEFQPIFQFASDFGAGSIANVL